MGLSARIPWWFKMGAKLGLSRLPVPYGLWKRIGMFRHGEMMLPENAIRAFESHFADAVDRIKLPKDFSVLELGPGDSVLSGFVAIARGAGRAWLVDAGPFAEFDVETCRRTIGQVDASGKTLERLTADSAEALMAEANVVYLTEGTASMKEIPDASVDYFWSQVVLEHIYREEFPQLMAELRRVAKPGAIGIHSIDYRDHLGGGLNNLRLPGRIWEAENFRDSGFYTNRIRPREMLEMIENAGFAIELIAEDRWPEMPLPRDKMAAEFRDLPDEDFMVREIRIAMKPV